MEGLRWLRRVLAVPAENRVPMLSGADSERQANSCVEELSTLLDDKANAADHLRLSERLAEICESQGFSRLQADALFLAAKFARIASQQERAHSLTDHAKIAFEKIGDDQALGKCLLFVGALFVESGSPLEALPRYKLAVSLFERTGDKASLAACDFNIGLVYFQTGRLREALVDFTKAEAAYESLGMDGFAGACILNCANVHQQLGQRTEAVALYRRARDLFERHGDRRRIGSALINLGNVYFDMGFLDESERCCLDALAIFEDLGETNRAAGCNLNLASIWGLRGERAKAIPLFERALETFEQLGDKRRIAECMIRLGIEDLKSKERERARFRIDRGIELSTASGDVLGEALGLMLLGDWHLDEEPGIAAVSYERSLSKLEAMRQEIADPEMTVRFAAQFAELPAKIGLSNVKSVGAERAFTQIQRAKGAALRAETFANRMTDFDLREVERAKLDRLRESAEQKERELGDTERNSFEHLKLKREVELATAELRAAEIAIHAERVDLDLSAAEEPAIEGIRDAIGRTAAVIEYAAGNDGLLIICFRGDGGPPFAEIQSVGRQELEAWADRLAGELASPRGDPAKLLRRGYDMLVAPVAMHLEGVETLVVCPDGPLHRVPFGALYDREDDCLLTKFCVTHSASAEVYAKIRKRRSKAKPGRRSLIVAVTDFGDRFPRLEFAAREAETAAELLPGASVLRDQDATRDRVLDLMSGAGIIHFATHANQSPSDPLRSSILLGGDCTQQFITARQICGLRLDAELVTLSACATESGELTLDGQVGLTWACLAAGSGSVVSTLWRVSDEAAADWVAEFYKEIANGSPKGEAFRAASLKSRNSRFGSPHFWAAWRLSGSYI